MQTYSNPGRRGLSALPNVLQIHYLTRNEDAAVGRIFGRGASLSVDVGAGETARRDRWRQRPDGKWEGRS